MTCLLPSEVTTARNPCRSFLFAQEHEYFRGFVGLHDFLWSQRVCCKGGASLSLGHSSYHQLSHLKSTWGIAVPSFGICPSSALLGSSPLVGHKGLFRASVLHGQPSKAVPLPSPE